MAAFLFLLPFIVLILACVGMPLFLFVDRVYSANNMTINLSRFLDSDLLLDQLFYTLLQGGISALSSIAIALLLAFFWAGFHWPGRRLFFVLSSVPFALPGVVVASGFIIVYGRSGHIGSLLGSEVTLLYNFAAVTAAHVFFNFPFIFKRIVLAAETLPIEFYKTSEILGLRRLAQFRVWIWPEIKNLVASLFLSTYILCFSSFAIVLILGGNPRQSTLEVAIYDMLQSEGEWWGAGVVSLLQMLMILPFIAILRVFTKKSVEGLGTKYASSGLMGKKPISDSSLMFRLVSYSLLFSAIFFLAAPLFGIIYDGLRLDLDAIPDQVYFKILHGFKNSFILALAVAVLGVFISWITARGLYLCKDKSQTLFKCLDGLIWVLMALSPAVLSVAWLHFTNSFDLRFDGMTYFVLVIIQVVLCLPFLIRMIIPAIESLELRFLRTTESLAVTGFKKMIWIEWPELKPVLLACAAVAFSFSLGEVVSLLIFARGQFPTIASLIFEFMGAYKFSLGALMASVLMFLCSVLIYVSERWITGKEVDLD